MLNSIMLYTMLLGLPQGRPGMLVFRTGSVSRIPMVDNSTALGTVTIVSGEQMSQDKSGSNLSLYIENKYTLQGLLLVSDVESVFYLFCSLSEILLLPVFSVDKRPHLLDSGFSSLADDIWILYVENMELHKNWYRWKRPNLDIEDKM